MRPPVGKLALIAIAAMLLSCGEEGRPLNVVIIGVDTLRPDHLGCYGYERSTSPNIDALAEQGVLFVNVVSQSPWTLPSFATVFTSLYPTQHGAGSLKSLMRTSFPPLAMILLKHGYSTGAIINAPALKREFGVNRGFEFYDVSPPGVERIADEVTEDALAWIDLNKGAPFFAFVHYFDPHLSYAPPAPYDTLFDPDYRGRIGDSFDLTYFPTARATNFETMKVLTAADWNHIESLYDGEIAYTDRAVGDLLAGLEARGLKDNTLIVFLSDHGEEFFEHGGFEHGHSMFDELLRVPLVFALPKVVPEGMRIRRQVRLLDITPTILDLLDIEPGTRIEGVSLKPYLEGRGEVVPADAGLLPDHIAFSEAMLHGSELKCVAACPWKLIYDTVTEGEMLFNLEHDPGEQHNLIEQETEVRSLLEEAMLKTMFGLSDTWYVEMVGGPESHTFDLEIATRQRPIAGTFHLRTLFDEEGHILDPAKSPLAAGSGTEMRMSSLDIKEPLTLAFQVSPGRASITFDLKIDGEPAVGRTFMGEAVVNPEEMPFTTQAGRRHASSGIPATRPEPPYFLVWHHGTGFDDERPVRLDDEIKKELRALGYIQ